MSHFTSHHITSKYIQWCCIWSYLYTVVIRCLCDDCLGAVQCECCSWSLVRRSPGVSDGRAIGCLRRCPWASLWQGSCHHLRQIYSHCRLPSERLSGAFHGPFGPSSDCGSCCQDHRIRWPTSLLHWLWIRSLRSLVWFPSLVRNHDPISRLRPSNQIIQILCLRIQCFHVSMFHYLYLNNIFHKNWCEYKKTVKNSVFFYFYVYFLYPFC